MVTIFKLTNWAASNADKETIDKNNNRQVTIDLSKYSKDIVDLLLEESSIQCWKDPEQEPLTIKSYGRITTEENTIEELIKDLKIFSQPVRDFCRKTKRIIRPYSTEDFERDYFIPDL